MNMKRFPGFSLLFLTITLSAQTPFAHPTSQEVLSNPHVNVLVEDRDGLVWAGTQRGLNRYNGTTYSVYFQEEDGLPNDIITSLVPDTEGRMWVGTWYGISQLQDGKVLPEKNVRLGVIRHMENMDEGHLLYSTREGLHVLDKATLESHSVYLNKRLTYNHFILLPDGKVWIYDNANNLIVLDRDWRVLRDFHLSQGHYIRMSSASDGTVWVCTDNGLYHYAGNGDPVPVPPAILEKTTGKNVLFYTERSKEAFFGIQWEGVYQIIEDRPKAVWSSERLAEDLSCNPLLTRTNLWLSETKGHLKNLFRDRNEFFLPLPGQFGNNSLNMFYNLGGKEVLVVTNTGLFRSNLDTKEYHIQQGNGLEGSDKIGITLHDRLGYWWIQWNSNELRKYRRDGDRFELLQRWPISPTLSIWDDASGNVFLLQGDTILRFTPDGRQDEIPATEHPEFWFCGQLSSGRVYFLADDDIWFLGQEGHFFPLESGLQSPTCLYEDISGKWWIGTMGDGLWQYDPKDRSLQHIDFGDKGLDHCIRSVSGDKDGNIWAALRFDYIRISNKGNLTYFISPDEGLSSNFTNNMTVMDDGTPVFGTPYKLNYFPLNLEQYLDPVILTLDNVFVNGLQTSADKLLQLDHRTEQLSFFYSGKNFNPAIKLNYRYKLEGYDNDWIYAGQVLRTRYSGLKSGRYTFRVQVEQYDGTISPNELSVPVRIKPSPWLSWPARLFYLLILAGLVTFFIRQYIRFRVNREKLEFSEQEKDLIRQISQERTTFFTDVSHEFRTPLSLIYGPVKELGKSPSLTENDRKLVGIIDRNSERMIRLTDQLLHFNQSQTNRDSLSVMRTDLTVLLRQMLRNFEYMFRQKNLQAAMDLPSELVVFCDREKVERIVFNLLSNAVKYTPEHGRILLSASQADGQAIVTVADTGIGISPDKMERIFERYERLGDKVGDALPSGFGIGLNYAKHLAVIHKGDLTVHPNDPIGSVFTFSFPSDKQAYSDQAIWQEETAEGGSESIRTELPPAPEGKKANLLVVEDNADMREYIRGFLQDEYHVTMAGDGEEAWNLIRINAPDLVVSDVMMPFKDGYTLCKELKNDAEYCHIPIILLTAKADMDNQLHGLELGADGYIGKPFDPAFLVAQIRNLLANRKRVQAILSEQTATSSQIATDMSPQDKAFLERCWKIIEEHLSEEDFNVTMLSMEVGMSRTSVYTKLTALTGQSPQAYLTNYRLNRAMDLLKEHTWNIGEVAYKVGFSTHTGFSRAFKNKFGVPPSQV